MLIVQLGDRSLELDELCARPPCCSCCKRPFDDSEKVIENEYGDLYTLEEFRAVLEECPVQFIHSVGAYFS